jgi:hypothetical protein
MAKDRIQKNDVISPSVNKEIETLNKNLATSVKLMTDLTKASIDLQKNTNPQNLQQVTAAQKESNKLSEESIKVNKDRLSTTEQLRQKIKGISEEEERLKIELQKKRKEVKENIKAEKAQSGSINDLNRKNKILRERIKNVSAETANGRKRILAYNKAIDKNTQKIFKASDAMTKQKMSIGQYGNALGALPGSFGQAATGAQRFGATLKALAANPIVLIIVGIVAAFKGLVALFKSTDDGGTKLEATMNGLKAVMQIFKGVLLDVIEGTKARFERFGKRFQLLKAQIKGNDEEIARLKDEIKDLSDTIQGNKPFENIGDRAKDAFKAVSDLTFKMDELNDRIIGSISSQKELELEMERYITLSKDQTLSDEDRISALEKGLKAAEDFYGNQRKFAQENFDNEIAIEAARRETSAETLKELILMDGEAAESARKTNDEIARIWNESGDERIQSLEEMYVSFVDSDVQYEKKISRIISQLSGLQKRTAEERIIIKETENEDILALIEEQNEAELEILEEKLDAENELLIGKEEEKFMTIEELRQQDIANQQEADESKKQSTQAYVDFAIGQAQQLSNGIFGLLDAQAEAQKNADIEKAKSRGASEAEIEKIEKEAAKKKKNRAITEAVINTALGVTTALYNPGGILGLVIAALVAISGAIQIATISSASFAKGTKDSGSQGMIAEVGERGTERINYADGTSALTPNGSTYTYLPPHSEVVPNHRLQQDLADMQMIGSRRTSRQDDEQRRRQEQKEIIKAIRNRDETTVNITEGGFYVTAKKGENRIKYITRKYRK